MNKRILVIDDDEGIRDAFEAMLSSNDYIAETSPNADWFINKTNSQMPDLILLDVLLSGSDGRDICRRLKADSLTSHIPIIMISAHPGIDDTIKRAGADDFLAKPFDMDTLLSKVAHYVNKPS